ncbi:MAG: hypothetical protein J7K68_06295 [Candidatus Diapherotrites archaeon]|nr:hypothetical protein [Candidatus Diapherotrites archaeon]
MRSYITFLESGSKIDVIAVGFKRGKIIVNDPHAIYGGTKVYPEKDLEYATYSAMGPVMFVSV